MKRSILLLLCLVCGMFLGGCGAENDTVTVIPAAVEEEAEEDRKKSRTRLAAQYYGYWEIHDARGEWAELKNNRWDCCASFYDGQMLLWDEDIWKDPGLALLEITQDGDEYSISGGRFLDREDGCEQWRLEFICDECGDMLVISGSYDAVYGGDFSLVMRLRPWGELWPEGDRPDNYEFWYLPLVEAGREMPDTIGEE